MYFLANAASLDYDEIEKSAERENENRIAATAAERNNMYSFVGRR